MNKYFMEIIQKSLFSLVGQIISQILAFVSIIIIVRLVGIGVYGEYIFLISFIVLLEIIPNFGMNSGLVYYLANEKIELNEKRSILNFSLMFSIFIGVIIIIISCIYKDFISYKFLKGNYLFVYFLPLVVLNNISRIVSSSLRAFRKIKEITFIENIYIPLSKIVYFSILIILCRMHRINSLIIANYITIISSLGFYFLRLKKMNLIGYEVSFSKGIVLLQFSLPLVFSNMFNIIILNIDKVMLGNLVDVNSVAIYKMVLQFAAVTSIALGAVNSIFAPIISTLYQNKNLYELAKIYKFSTKLIVSFNLLIFGMIVVFSKEILGFAGQEFKNGSWTLIIISFGRVINCMVGPVNELNVMTGKSTSVFLSQFISLIINIGLNYFLIKEFGIVGVAIATSVSIIIKNLISFIFMYKNINIHPYDSQIFILVIIFIVSTFGIFIISKIFIVGDILNFIICGVIYSVIFSLLIIKVLIKKEDITKMKVLLLK